MSFILSHLKTLPYSVRKRDKSWIILPNASDDVLDKVAKSFSDELDNTSGLKNILSSNVIKSIKEYHPNLKINDFSRVMNLILFTHLQATGLNENYYVGGVSGSVQYSREDALLKTIYEVVERTALKILNINLSNVWGSSVSPMFNLSKEIALNECIERIVILNACNKNKGYSFSLLGESYYTRLMEAAIFEWTQNNAKVLITTIKNPYNIPVALAKVIIEKNNKKYIFYGNGIGKDHIISAEKAIKETLQFIPRGINFFENLMESNDKYISEVMKWSKIPIEISILNNEDENCSLSFQEKCTQAAQDLKINTNVIEIPFIKDMFLGYAKVQEEKHWSTYEGIPIV